MLYSFIIPVYNRPEEVDELLESLTHQTLKNFEVLIVEDGSKERCEHILKKYTDQLDLHYFFKPNSGPADSRNFGAKQSKGEFLIILDSDCIAPSTYLEEVDRAITTNSIEAYGGPDAAHDSFTPIQKAINYAMTSFFTTGGIRGGKKKMDKFYPRSFNLGIKKEAFEQLNGFSSDMRFGEDIDFSIRIYQNNYNCTYLPQAWVYHKRRSNFRQFFKQVHNSGIARINLFKKYPSSLKLVHLLPTLFTLGTIVLLLGSLVSPWLLLPLAIYSLLVFIDSSIQNKSFKIGALSVLASFVQLLGYGSGFLLAWWKRCILKKDEFAAFNKTFYK
ncbi:glycosyltransferase [Bacteroides propionicifaciens]|uniref:glycosyltransferase n=1 Tax=Bacteroides propionicifaciens TaxID=392838 RepID=UPI0003811DBF|nr:glycosyltransferase [Bacteroides propionicifaciens]